MLPGLKKCSPIAKVSQGYFAKFPREHKNGMEAPLLSPFEEYGQELKVLWVF